jgi:hypothetical protein
MSVRTPSGAVLLAALLLAACRSEKRADAPVVDAGQPAHAAGEAAAAAPAVVTVTASDYAFEAPAEIPGGFVTMRLVNKGPSLHHVQLLKLEAGKTMEDFTAALKAGGPPRWALPAGGPNPPQPGDSSTVQMKLEPGQYVMVCFVPAADGQPHLMKGMMRPLTVTASGSTAAAEPTADIVMKLVDFSFDLSKPLTSGRHILRIDNDGKQPHEVAIVRMEPGKDPLSFASWGERPTGPAPGQMYGGVSAIMPGTQVYVPLDLPPGEYGLLCFVPEMKDGKPHFVHGMVKKVTIS